MANYLEFDLKRYPACLRILVSLSSAFELVNNESQKLESRT